jgi:hypothetical protein
MERYVMERYVANASNIGTPAPAAADTVEMAIERWSTDAEHDRLMAVLQERGPDKLLDELQKLPRVGAIRTPNSIVPENYQSQPVLLTDVRQEAKTQAQ